MDVNHQGLNSSQSNVYCLIVGTESYKLLQIEQVENSKTVYKQSLNVLQTAKHTHSTSSA